jgi:hypothetical protein
MDTTEYTYTPHTLAEAEAGVAELLRLAMALQTYLAKLDQTLREVEEPLPVVEAEE